MLTPSVGSVLLDRALSSPTGWEEGSLLFTLPEAIFRGKDGRFRLAWRDGKSQELSGDPFTLLQEVLADRPGWRAAGYWGYDLRYGLERLPHLAQDDLQLPDCWVGLYPPDAIHQPKPGTATLAESILGNVELLSTHTPSSYASAVRKVKEYIAAGDCYQVNLSQRFHAPATRGAWPLYRSLRQVSPAPFAAYLDCGDHQVVSSSPELFLRIRNGQVETHPIKGTRPRGATPEADRAAASALLTSPKDRAELLMIVDLERNDLGRVCQYGSVRVPRTEGDWARLESYSNVHHLVSTVRGTLRPEVTPLEALRACFPGGSITGAPKIRAMEIIEELEPVRRGVYTGAIGWVDGQGNGEWNIAIRTMVVKGGVVYFHAGGGIVADSDPDAEYAETLAKASGMRRALGL